MYAVYDTLIEAISDINIAKDILKLVLDKLLIGVLLLIAGFYISRWIEKYKSTQSIIQEQQKLLFPEARGLIDKASKFLETYLSEVKNLDTSVVTFKTVISRIMDKYADRLGRNLVERQQLISAVTKENRSSIIDEPIVDGKTLRELLT